MLKPNPAKAERKVRRFEDTCLLFLTSFLAWVMKKHPAIYEDFKKALFKGEVAQVMKDALRESEEDRASK